MGLLILEVLAQPNLSTSCLLVFVTLFLLMAGGMRKRTLIVLLSIAVVGFFILARFVIPEPVGAHRLLPGPRGRTSRGPGLSARAELLRPGQRRLGSARGSACPKQKHNFLPYAYSDFIFAIVGEELGFAWARAGCSGCSSR